MTSANSSSSFELASIATCLAELEDGKKIHQGWSPQCEKLPASDKEWGVLKTTSIQAGRFEPEHNKHLPTKLAARPHLQVKPGDILLTCAGPRHRCGVSCLVKQTRERLMISGKMYRFRANTARVRPDYLEAFLQTETARQAIDRMKTGISDSGLNLTHDRFRQLVVPLAPLREQERIVAEIDKQFTRLDAGVASLKRVQTALKRYRASVLKAACEGRLVRTEAELARKENRTYETGEQLLQRILKERREKWSGRGKHEEPPSAKIVDLPQRPEGWTWATVQQLNPADRPCSYGVLQPGPDVLDGIPLVRVGDINNGKVDQIRLKLISPKIAARYPRTKLQGGEVAISLVGAIGRTAVIPQDLAGANTARAVGIMPITKLVDSNWVEIWFRNPRKIAEMTSKSHEVARKTLNLEDVRAASVALPPLPEQLRVVAEIERRFSVIDELDSAVSSKLQRADRLRRSILQQAFNSNS